MLDIFIIVVLLWALFSGWRAGFIKEVASMVGALVGLLVAATCYSSFGEYLAVNGSETNMVTSVIAFFLLWIFVPIVLGYVANVLTKSLKGMKLGMPNSILGALVSPGEGFFPSFDKGVYPYKNGIIYVDSGLGNTFLPLRFLNKIGYSNIEIKNGSVV